MPSLEEVEVTRVTSPYQGDVLAETVDSKIRGLGFDGQLDLRPHVGRFMRDLLQSPAVSGFMLFWREPYFGDTPELDFQVRRSLSSRAYRRRYSNEEGFLLVRKSELGLILAPDLGISMGFSWPLKGDDDATKFRDTTVWAEAIYGTNKRLELILHAEIERPKRRSRTP